MLYIHQHTCISPQKTFADVDLDLLHESVDNKLLALEQVYEGIPPAALRRMGKAVKMGIGAGLPIIKNNPSIDGIILGTSNGGMEDCIRFLNQIIDYDEGMLTPGNFVQSTPNAIASQLSMMNKNRSYNITHVHRGVAFENALLDAVMMLKENPGKNYLLGGVDEISAYNFNIDYLGGWYKKEKISNKDLYQSQTPASIAGEGAAMFLVNDDATGAVAKLSAMKTLHTDDVELVKGQLKAFINNNSDIKIDLFLSGENGDSRILKFYESCEAILDTETPVARFKHMCGEYPTASSFSFWLSCYILEHQRIPGAAFKKSTGKPVYKNILVYNSYKGRQHSFLLVSKAP